MTYHVDFIKTEDSEKLWQFLPPKTTLAEGRKEAQRLYDSFYTYSDVKFDESFKYKAVRHLYKYFYDHADCISELAQDPKKVPLLEGFYNRCLSKLD